MKYFYDVHIHTALSPCADVLMSPNNILNMAMLKELNIIAITDHNSCLQLDVIEELKESYEMLVVPGAEIEVKEKYHVVCLFASFEEARRFQKEIESYLHKTMHDEVMYGEQHLFDVFDDIVNQYQVSLMGSSNIGLLQLRHMMNQYQGIMILAQIEKLHTIYQDIFDAIEVNANTNIEIFNHQLESLEYKILRNSDAHQIIDISEPVHTIELEDLTIESLFKAIKGKRNHG